MKAIIDGATYTAIKKPTFRTETDMSGNSLPVGSLSLEIETQDDIRFGRYIELRDDLDNLWARYYIVYAERGDPRLVTIRAQSPVALMGRTKLPAVMYENAPVAEALDDVFYQLGDNGFTSMGDYTLDPALAGETVSGFCPEQTPRERLQWICFVLGAYVRDSFGMDLQILPRDEAETPIPIDKTYWKPTVTYEDYVTAIKAYTYAYTALPEGEEIPSGAQTVTDGTTTWTVEKQTMELGNTNAPYDAPPNVVEIEGVTLLNAENAGMALANMARYWFKRATVTLEVINNGEYMPGQKVLVYTDERQLMAGYIQSCEFTFGVQAKDRLTLKGTETVDGTLLTLIYMYANMQLDKREYYYPAGFSYKIQNPYFDSDIGAHRYIFRPENECAEGVVDEGGTEDTQPCAVALDLYRGILTIVSVDGITEASQGEAMVGVIK